MLARLSLLGILLAMWTVSCVTPEEPGAESTEAAPPGMAASAAALSFTVQVDGSGDDFAASSLAYFPRKVTIHPGDTVDFRLVDTGDPHTVTFGTLADAAAAAWEEKGWEAADGPEFAKLPLMIPDDAVEAIQSAAQPCLLTGEEPGEDACEAQELPVFDGSPSFYNSGWMAPDEDFSVTFAPETAPGTYRYVCLLHMPFMTGSVTVAAPDEDIPTLNVVAQSAKSELESTVALIRPAVAAAAPAKGAVMAGILSEDAPQSAANVFIPEELEITAGDSVTWSVLGPHTISFNSPPGAYGLRVAAPDGSIHVNPLAAMPDNVVREAPPSDSLMPVEIDGGSWDGKGSLSSGLVLSFPPAPLYTFNMAFEEPGAYPYVCLIHPAMVGRIVVK